MDIVENLLMKKDKFGLLNQIDYPEDLRKLSIDQLPQICEELRQDIIQEVSVNPGHFASSLGAVELTVALHYVFDTPKDKLVWDVGHQAYGHKILTGRRKAFNTNRKLRGLRPFPTPLESEYDTFTCGHASNSISAALGMAVATKQNHEDNKKIVAIIGDGAMSGGLAFEGLNNVSSTPNDLLIVLNDNDMSIDHAVGGMEKYLLTLDTNATYNKLRFKASQWLHQRGYLDDKRKKGILRLNNAIKSAISHQQNVFEGMNIRYFGPFDGHNIKEIVRILQQLKEMKGPKLLHLHTTKGKGYKPAELSQIEFHAPGKFNIETGQRIQQDNDNQAPKYQDVFGDTLVELAKLNPKIVGITPAMPTGCSMNKLIDVMPDRAFDVGIAEGHAVTFSGGLAKEGMMPFCNIYSSFSQRAYDNIIHDLAILNLPVVLCLDRAGLVGEDGATHHGMFDMAALRPIPHLTIAAPMDERELRRLMYTAQLPNKGTFVIRYPRGRGVHTDWKCPLEEIKVGTGRRLRSGKDLAILSIGPVGNDVEKVLDSLGTLYSIAHYDMRFVKPLDETLLEEVGKHFQKVITIEDGIRMGGFGSAVLEWFNDHGYDIQVKRMGIPDQFVEHGSVDELKALTGIDTAHIQHTIQDLLSAETMPS